MAFCVGCMVMIANLQYGWTLFVRPISVAHQWSVADIQIAFSIFVALETPGLGVDLRSGRDQSRNKFRRIVGEVVEAAKDRALWLLARTRTGQMN